MPTNQREKREMGRPREYQMSQMQSGQKHMAFDILEAYFVDV